MTNESIAIGTRSYQSNFSFDKELVYLTNKNYLFDLNTLSVIEVSGEKSSEFLQGQLSCDIQQVTQTTMQQGALCNIKGRVLTLLDVISCWGSYWLILPSDLVTATLTSLEKIAQLSRVTLKARDNIKVWGLLKHSNQDILPKITLPNHIKEISGSKTHCCYQINSQDYLVLTLKNDTTLNYEDFKTHHQLKSDLAWHFWQLKQNCFSIYPETRGLFLPHRLNLQNTGYISFNKGCYKGQEIIARTHYRATLKHKFIVATIKSSTPPQLGAKLYDPETAFEIGELIDYCPVDKTNHYLIACSVLIEQGCAFRFENEETILRLSDIP